MYEVVWSERSKKDLECLEKLLIRRIVDKVEGVRAVPHHFLERLVGSREWKLRVGDYRVFIDLDDKNKILRVLHVEHRKKAYK